MDVLLSGTVKVGKEALIVINNKPLICTVHLEKCFPFKSFKSEKWCMCGSGNKKKLI